MTDNHEADPAGSPPSRLPVRAMTWVLLGVAVLAVIVVVAEVARLRPRYDDMKQRSDDRTEVVALTQQWATLTNTYSPETFDTWAEQVSALLSTRFRTEFEQETEALRPTIDQIKLTSKGTVLKTGVASLDDDSAVVLVVADADTTSTLRPAQRHFRWQVDLVKVDDEWLVDDFNAVQDPTTETPQ